MKVSIVTACFNSEKTIGDTIDSVFEQDFDNLELIVIDGNSSDNTCDLIRSYRDKRLNLISEDDHGIYFAMNKGINLCKGDIIGFLNSDDFFHHDSVLSEYIAAFETGVDCCYGDIVYVTNNEREKCKPIRNWISSDYNLKKFSAGWVPPHPTFYAKKELFNSLGGFNTQLNYAADFDLMCRFLTSKKVQSLYLPGAKVSMRVGGVTNNSVLNILKGNREILTSLKKNKIKFGPSFFYFKILERFKQYLNAS